MARVVHFEVHADEPERAVDFYGSLFGWTFQRYGETEYWLATTGEEGEPGIDGAIMRRQTPLTAEGIMAFVCTVQVTDLDETMSAAQAKGASVALPKQAIPGVGWLAYLKDTEKNVFGLMQPDRNVR